MSLKAIVFVLTVAVGLTHSLPAYEDRDVEFVNPRGSGGFYDFDPDTFDFPSNNDGFGGLGGFGFPDFGGRISDYINRFRKSIAAAFAGAADGIDLSKGNTTTETKIVDGNRITINRTVYNENGVQIIVKKVEVRPVGDSGEDIPSSTGTGSTPAILEGTSTSTVASATRDAEDIETFDGKSDSNNEVGSNVPQKLQVQ